MWVNLETWLVQDGTLPFLQRGHAVREVGLVATCWSVGPASGPDGIVEEQGLDPDGESSHHCQVTGTVEWSRMNRQVGSQIVLSVDDFQLFAEPRSSMQPLPHIPRGGQPWWRPRRFNTNPEVQHLDFVFPPPHGRVAVHCQLAVCPEYVLEDLDADAPEVRADWLVQQIEIELRERVWHGDSAESGQVVRVEDIDQMQWSDEDDNSTGCTYSISSRPLSNRAKSAAALICLCPARSRRRLGVHRGSDHRCPALCRCGLIVIRRPSHTPAVRADASATRF